VHGISLSVPEVYQRQAALMKGKRQVPGILSFVSPNNGEEIVSLEETTHCFIAVGN
jgi:hypothetical protein